MKTKNKKTVFYRQGDVLLVKVNEIPSNLKQLEKVVLAYGEATGHAHEICNGNTKAFAAKDETSGLADYIEVQCLIGEVLAGESGGAAAVLEHAEHGSISIPPGKYKIVRQREYTPEAIKQVVD